MNDHKHNAQGIFDPIAYLVAIQEARFLNPKKEHLALKMLATADELGVCNRSVLELCNAIGVGERQLANLRRELAAEGFIEQKKRGYGRGQMSEWQLLKHCNQSSPRNTAMRQMEILQNCRLYAVRTRRLLALRSTRWRLAGLRP